VPELQQQCGQANVNGTKLRNMLIPLPPLAEQQRIVSKVDELMALCDRLERRLIEASVQISGLLEAVLQHALNDASETSSMATPSAIRNVDTAVSAI